jgi:hypothetical protein
MRPQMNIFSSLQLLLLWVGDLERNLLVCGAFSIYSSFVFVFHLILYSPSSGVAQNLFFIDTHDGFLVSLAMPQHLTP